MIAHLPSLALLLTTLSAAIFLAASFIKIPMHGLASAWGTLVGLKEVVAAYDRQGFWNKVAGVLAMFGALFQALAMLYGPIT